MDDDDHIHIQCNKRINQSAPLHGNYFKDGRTKIGRRHQQLSLMHWMKSSQLVSSNRVDMCGGGTAFRLCAGVGNTLAEETAREGEDGRRGGGAGRGEGGEQQV